MMWENFADAALVKKKEMKARISHYITLGAALTAWVAAIGGCTTAELSPPGPLPALPPPYVQVAHPNGYTISDLRAIFTTPSAPKEEEFKDCDADFKKLRSATQVSAELAQGARELVRRDPVKYHWCYYGRVLQLEDTLKSESYLDEKQKSVIDTYAVLTPLARAFMQEYHDSRYMRWGVNHYRQVSAWIFYRKMEMTPQATSELVEASNPFGLLKEASPALPILEKYGIAKAPDPVPLPPPATTAASVPPTMPATPPAVPDQSVAGEVAAVPASTASPVPAPEPLAPASTLTTAPGATPATEFVAPPVETVAAPAPAAPDQSVITTPAAPEPEARAPAAAQPDPVVEPTIDSGAEAILQGDSVVPTND